MKNIILKIIFGAGVLVSVVVFVYLYNSGGGAGGITIDASSTSDSDIALVYDASSSLEASSSEGLTDLDFENLASIQQTVKPSATAKKTTAKSMTSVKDVKSTAPVAQASVTSTAKSATIKAGASLSSTSGRLVAAVSSASSVLSGASTSASIKTLPQFCSFSTAGIPSHKIILNEIAWMGSSPQGDETATQAGAREWIELKNTGASVIDLSGWQILDSTGNLKIMMAATATTTAKVPAGGFYLLSRGTGYSGALSNSGGVLAVFDANCGLSDFLDASANWPGGNNTTKQTLERDADGFAWHTSVTSGGTPSAKNSIPAPVAPAAIVAPVTVIPPVVAVTPAPAETTTPSSSEETASASSTDATSGNATSTDSEPAPDETPVISGTVTTSTNTTTSSSPTSTSPAATLNHLVIAQIQIAGATSANDFVKIFNPTSAAIDMSGWKLHKKSGTGTDYSLRTFAAGSAIAAGGYFTWANSGGGFADSIGADISSAETLSADNSVALLDPTGTVIDQVAWGTGTNQYVEGAAYATNPTANQILKRNIVDGAIVDADNNASDFIVQ